MNIQLFNSIARVATPTPVEVKNSNLRDSGGQPKHYGARIYIVVTAITATPSVVFNVEAWDEASQTWILILASAAIIAAGTTTLRIFPGATVAANVGVNDFLPERWRIRPVHADADSITYSVGANLLTN
jgi:hypothetical protein